MALKTWRSRQARTQQAVDLSPSKTDVVLSRVANGSQIGLLVLAAFGYFYTVIPVYQKSLLDEQIAQKTLELGSKEAALKNSDEELARRRSELAEKDAELAKRTDELSSVNAEVTKTKIAAERAQKEADKLRGTVQAQYGKIRSNEFQGLITWAPIDCNLGRNGASGEMFDCVRKRSAENRYTGALNDRDRRLLLTLIDAERPRFEADIRTLDALLSPRRADAAKKLSAANERCKNEKGTAAAIQCNTSIVLDNNGVASIEVEREIAMRRSAQQALERVAKKFGVLRE